MEGEKERNKVNRRFRNRDRAVRYVSDVNCVLLLMTVFFGYSAPVITFAKMHGVNRGWCRIVPSPSRIQFAHGRCNIPS